MQTEATAHNRIASQTEEDSDLAKDFVLKMPMNVEALAHLDTEEREEITWFHQHSLERELRWSEMERVLAYDKKTIYRVLKGTYVHGYEKIVEAIQAYRRIEEERTSTQQQEFVETPITKLIFTGLNYTLANRSITLIVGPSRRGKTTAIRKWRERNNHGRSVVIDAPAYGGPKALLREIAASVGINPFGSTPNMISCIYKAFSPERILIVDEVRRLLPSERKSVPVCLEILRDLHDRTGCALALIATERFEQEIKTTSYQYEQLLGRIGLPIKLPAEMKEGHFMPLVRQYIRQPSKKLADAAMQIANSRGSLGTLVETLKVASRIAAQEKKPLAEAHVFQAMAIRRSMSGEVA